VTVQLQNKNIVVTGGSMGLGLESARSCLKYGANVAICARGRDDLDRAESELRAEFPTSRVLRFVADVSHEAQVNELFASVVSAFGRIDGVIHAAGVYGPIGPITDLEPDAWWDAVRINLFGTFLVARAAAREMNKTGGGRIVLYSGGGAAAPFPNYTAYASSKVGVVRLTETIAQELAPTIEVNCIAPGFVVTRLHQETLAAADRAGGDFLEKTRAQLQTGGVPATVGAEAAAFFVSSAAQGITGKFVAAPYDAYSEWPTHLEALRTQDIFTLRRILPRERGADWQ
jgi:NAD(P)-dependent dehydrogenase (short-subunit alcohol dehydrogenase family)